MYAYFVDPENVVRDGNMIKIDKDKHTGGDNFYWRKFNHLHGWMENLYQERGGVESFNCIDLELTSKDLTALKKKMKTGLKHTPGFFFGGSEVSEYDMERLERFIIEARQAIKDGKVVIYSSWW